MIRGRSWGATLLVMAILVLSIVGARTQQNAYLFSALGLMAVAPILVVVTWIPERWHPYLLYAIGLGILWQASLTSNGLVGTDIHGEFYWSYATQQSGRWDWSVPHSYNASLLLAWLLPKLATLTHLPLVWWFKVITPMFLAGVPVILYTIAKPRFGARAAFLTAFFLISVPTFFVELVGIAKQQVAELLLMLAFWVLLTDRLRERYKALILAGLLDAIAVTHYTVAAIAYLYIGGFLVVYLLITGLRERRIDWSSVRLGAVLVVVAVGITVYYGWVADGKPLREIVGRWVGQIETIQSVGSDANDPSWSDMDGIAMRPPPSTLEKDKYLLANTGLAYLTKQEDTVRIALGLDFASASPLGRVFRIAQFLTQVMLLVGAACILRRRIKTDPKFTALFLTSGSLLVAIALLPGFSYILNASRFYHLALLIAAPAVVVGGLFLLRDMRLVGIALVIYFLFASGLVFELTRQKDLTRLDLPYSYALSGYRVDATGISSDNDLRARDWIIDNKAFPVWSDMWAGYTIYERLGDFNTDFRFILPEYRSLPSTRQTPAYYLKSAVADNGYIFLRERNQATQSITFYSGPGTRYGESYEQAGIPDLIAGRSIVFQCGQAVVYGPKR